MRLPHAENACGLLKGSCGICYTLFDGSLKMYPGSLEKTSVFIGSTDT